MRHDARAADIVQASPEPADHGQPAPGIEIRIEQVGLRAGQVTAVGKHQQAVTGEVGGGQRVGPGSPSGKNTTS